MATTVTVDNAEPETTEEVEAEAVEEAAEEVEAIATETVVAAETAVALANTVAASAELQAAEQIEVHDERMRLWQEGVERQFSELITTTQTQTAEHLNGLETQIAELRQTIVSMGELISTLIPPQSNETEVIPESLSPDLTKTEPLASVVVAKPVPRRRVI